MLLPCREPPLFKSGVCKPRPLGTSLQPLTGFLYSHDAQAPPGLVLLWGFNCALTGQAT